MSREFVERHQIVERYLAGKLPLKVATDFERFCRDHPDLLDAIGLADRVNAGLRLLESGGQPEPWEDKPRKPWEKPVVSIALAAAAFALLVIVGVLAGKLGERGDRIAALEKQVAEQPLEPATRRRAIRLIPARNGPTQRPAVTLGGGETQLVDMKIDLSWSKSKSFRVTIDRADQGRVAVLHNLYKDSNGDLRIALNSSALGPGAYTFTIDGLNWRGEPQPEAWITIALQR
jgi:hypothetical protein